MQGSTRREVRPDVGSNLTQIKIPGEKSVNLYVDGEIKREDRIAVAVVGSRRITEYGRRVCRYMVEGLAAAGVTIVSGLMYGVDLEAHKVALNAGGRTIAVLGYGFDYLKTVRYAKPVVESILNDSKGAIVSEYTPDQVPTNWTFPARNRIVSALSKCVLVIEAAEDSGSIITAAEAVKQNKEVFVVPGSIFDPTSKGKHELIKDGLRLADSPEDILNYLKVPAVKIKKAVDELKGHEKIVYDLIESDSSHSITFDEILFKSQSINFSELNVILTSLEIAGIIKKDLAGRFLIC